MEPSRLSAQEEQPAVDGLRDDYSSQADDSSLSEEAKQASMLFSVAEGHLFDADAAEALKAAADASKIFRESGNAKGVADSLRIVSAAHRLNGDCGEARRVVEDELAVFRKAEDKRGEAAMLLSVAEVSLEEGKLEEALKLASDAREYFGTAGDSKMEATALLVLAKVRVAEELHREAVRSANAALMLFHKLKDQRGRAQGLRVLTSAHITGGATKEGLQTAEAATALFRELGSRREEAYELLRMARVNLESRKYPEALQLAKKAQALFQGIGFSKGDHLAVDTMVQISIEKEHLTWALTLAKDAVQRFEKLGDKRWEAAAMGDTLLQVHIERGSLDEALEAALGALDLCKEFADRKWEAKMLENVATVHMLNQDFEKASQMGQDAIALFLELGDFKNAGVVHYKLGCMQHQRSEHAEALQQVTEARSLFQKAGCRVSETTALLGMCYAHQMLGDYGTAAAEGKEALEKAEEAGDHKGVAAAYLNFTAMHMSSNSPGEAIESARKAEAVLREARSADKILGDALHVITQAFLQLGDPDSAGRPAHEARVIYQRVRDRAGEADALRLIAHIDQALLAREVKEPQSNNEKHWRTVNRLQATAVRSARDSVACFRKLGAKFPLGVALHSLAQTLAAAEEPDEALKSADEAVEIFRDLNDKTAEANALIVTADIYILKGDRLRATDAANSAAAIFRESGDAAGEAFAMGIFSDVDASAMGGMDMLANQAAQSVQSAPKLDPVVVRKMVMEKALEMLTMEDEDELHLDTPLMDAGLDSLSVIGFRDALQQEFPGINLPAEMTFDYPSAHAVAGFICESMG